MASQRMFQLGLRRAAAPSLRVQHVGRVVGRRFAATEAVSKAQGNEIIAKQRLLRPVSPHLAIYRFQINYLSSAFNRVTGLILSGSLYIFGIAYLVAPTVGWHLETASMVAAVAAWPAAVKVGVKAFFAAPFFFHSFNGLRHMVWDAGYGFKNSVHIRTGWSVVALTAATTLYYTFAG